MSTERREKAETITVGGLVANRAGKGIEEIWRWVVGYEGQYQVSNLGRVRSVDRFVRGGYGGVRFGRGRILKQGEDVYPFVGLSQNNKHDRIQIHRLVLLAFVGPCPAGMHCRHLNDNKYDNRLENLCWGTPKENRQDSVRNGTDVKGENFPHSKLKVSDVKTIRNLYKTGNFTQKQLAKRYKIHEGTISEITTRKIWRHVEDG